jgi:hypothetical protein
MRPRISINRVLNAAKPGHSADPVSAVTKKGKMLLGVEDPIIGRNVLFEVIGQKIAGRCQQI